MADPKTPAAGKPAPAAAPAPEATTENAGKSIIGAKYRDGRYKEVDWLGKLIAGVVNTTSQVEKKVPIEGKDGEFKNVMVDVNDGVNIDGLFKLARENGLDVDKFDAQRSSHGFAGRFRMTVRNMLQAKAKRQHGLIVGGKWTPADAEWLKTKGAPAAPTHGKDGVKIPTPKAAAPKATEDAAKDAPKK